jgi:hypothetical protein
MNSTLLNGIYGLLIGSAPTVALFCFVCAGFALRSEGGINYSTDGSFFKWITWGAIFLTITPILAYLYSLQIIAAGTVLSATNTTYTSTIQSAVPAFINNYLVDKIVPVVAGALVLKALLDTGEGHSPLPSIISALFLLGVDGFYQTAVGWNNTTYTATADLLQNMLNWALASVAPVLGAMSIYAAVLQYVRGRDWATPAFVGGALIIAAGIWSLVQKWAGVSL